MKALLIAFVLPLAMLVAASAHAQVPAGAPAGTTGLCKDGSYSSADSRRGACRGHKGIKDWYAQSEPAAAMPAAKTARTTATAAPATGAKPAGATGQCKDGSYSSADSKRGACRGHKGVQEWYAADASANAPSKTATAAVPAAPMPMPAPAPRSSTTPAPAPAPASTPPVARAPAAGGGNGQVWVNSETKVYHCQDDRYYGKTKQGEYLTEAAAIAKGAHASHGKSCSR